jgi:hypothetical protein
MVVLRCAIVRIMFFFVFKNCGLKFVITAIEVSKSRRHLNCRRSKYCEGNEYTYIKKHGNV